MTREEFIMQMNGQLKLVRTEYGFTQDAMARVLGISKKTLVEIEKGRSSLGWTGAVTLCSVFSGSQVLSGVLGGEAADMIQALAFCELKPKLPKTMGGKIWWETVETGDGWKIQQNIISRHYRALDGEDCRIGASFNLEEVHQMVKIL
ncbi:MAG: helix-turn-helix domain-containing protein [Firmicutes bacterium]|nr:helix-turn-helix domain-containing protein [Bacillota bacterium]